MTVPPDMEALVPFVEAGVLGAYEVQFAAAVLRLQPGLGADELLALAVAARAPRFGHVCTPLDAMAVRLAELDGEEADGLPWPPADSWASSLLGSAVVASAGPRRPWVRSARWCGTVTGSTSTGTGTTSWRSLTISPVARQMGPPGSERRRAPEPRSTGARLPVRSGRVRPIRPPAAGRATGTGPGCLDHRRWTWHRQDVHRGPPPGRRPPGRRRPGSPLSVALAAPTGKAAARMGEAVQAAVAALDLTGPAGQVAGLVSATDPTTIHSLLGWEDRTHFRHHRGHPLPEDMVIIDETSMVSLPLMAKLLDAVRPAASVVLVGDPYQLASIEAGTVMSDVVGSAGFAGPADGGAAPAGGPGSVVSIPTLWDSIPTVAPEPVGILSGRVTVLRTMRRFERDSIIAALAEAIRSGDARRALSLLDQGAADVRWVRPDDPDGTAAVTDELVAVGCELAGAAIQGDGSGALEAASRIKVLTATRRGPNGMTDWTQRIEQGVADHVSGFHPERRWHVGRPVLVTANDRANRVFNGDTGVVVDGDGGMEVALASGDVPRRLAPSRLDRVETWWAMTIHKSQGSEFPHAVVALPDAGSPILTRELLYTAVTRARDRLTVVSTAESLERAVSHPLSRASGLRARLWPD